MKLPLRGRALQVALNLSHQQTIEKLKDLGFDNDRAVEVAEAATKYANEETALLVRQLIPRSAWQGTVVIRRHVFAPREETWLMLKYHAEIGWNLDSALFL